MSDRPEETSTTLERRPIVRFGMILLAASILSSFVFGYRPRVRAPSQSIDDAYHLATNYAAVGGLRWGRDFVSTYGPYNYLLYAVDPETIGARKAAWEFLLAAVIGVACAAYAAVEPRAGRAGTVLVAVLLTYAINLQASNVREHRLFMLILLLSVLSLRATKTIRSPSFLAASALAGFFVLVKLSLGFGAIFTLAAASVVSRQAVAILHRLVLLGCGVTFGFSCGWVAHHGSPAGIGDFVSSARWIVSGYATAMSQAPQAWDSAAVYFAVFFAGLLLWVATIGSSRVWLTLLVSVAPFFIAWKQAMARQDAHLLVFVLTGLFVVCLMLKDVAAIEWRQGLLLTSMTLPALFAPWYLHLQTFGRSATVNLGFVLGAPLIPDIEMSAPRDAIESLRLPRNVRERVGRQPLDVYPWQIAYITANDFNWSGRPSPASFATYGPELDRMNADFFSSPERPRYLLWAWDSDIFSIDGRHLFWDEPQTLRTILDNYRLVARRSAFLLEDTHHSRLTKPRPVRVLEGEWDEWHELPETDGVLLAALDFRRPWWVSIRKAVLREDPMFVSVRFARRDIRTYRFVPDQAGSGLWMSPLPRDRGELHSILLGNFSTARPEAIRFHGGWASPSREPFVLSWLEMEPRAE